MLESSALRSVLEYFGARVDMHWIGRPNDLIKVLIGENRTSTDYLILSFHGEGGKLLLPELAEEVYEENEPRSSYFGYKEILKYARLDGIHVLATGCTLGDKELADAFHKSNCASYTAPVDYIDGNAALMFIISFMYEQMTNSKPIKEAFQIAQSIDKETNLYR
ncbi:delta-aminolevulinic acid dehydratase, partial [Virgibacillus sp. 7505]|uniref:delta-aminolevulinic acid dehydratase n=1 Tax=Virgibacillus sp. 7505 TaxID=2022548 RepID=UPI00256FE9D5